MKFIRLRLAAIAAALLIPAAAPAQDMSGGAMARMMRQMGAPGLEGKKLDKAVEKARAYPLGSEKNPVRASTPIGQRAYLARLRCTDGAAPKYDRAGNIGTGVYGYIIDHYRVRCGEAEPVSVYMDMYHDHVENEAVPGFTIVAEEGLAPTS